MVGIEKIAEVIFYISLNKNGQLNVSLVSGLSGMLLLLNLKIRVL